MIVCSCNVIAKDEILAVVNQLLIEDEWQLITPGMVYHAMNKRGRCCGCYPNVVALIVEASERHHRARRTPEERIRPFIDRIREQDGERDCAPIVEPA